MYIVFGMRGRWDFGPSSELSWLPPTRAFQTAGCGIEVLGFSACTAETKVSLQEELKYEWNPCVYPGLRVHPRRADREKSKTLSTLAFPVLNKGPWN